MNTINQTAFSGGKDYCAHKKAAPVQWSGIHKNRNNSNIEADFLAAMHAAGCAPADSGVVVAGGALHRYRIDGDKAGSKNGWFVLFADGVPSGAFGSWKHGVTENWSTVPFNSLSPFEREQQRRRIELAREAAKELQAHTHKTAAERARKLWESSKPASPNHPYLVRKQVKAGIARQMNDALVLPIQSNDALVGLQFIQPDGTKRILSGTAKRGHFIVVSNGSEGGRVLICEGWATGMTLAEAEPSAHVLAAIDAGNLEPVAVAVRKLFTDKDIVIACDNDRQSSPNVGVIKGRAAAVACGGKIIIPEFPEAAPPELSDFNDLVNFLNGGVCHAS